MNRRHHALAEGHKLLHSNGLAVALAAAFLVSGLLGCGAKDQENAAADGNEHAESSREHPKDYVVFGEYVNASDSLPHLRYTASGLVSINDRCAVRKVKLNPKMPPAWVNGQPVGFC